MTIKKYTKQELESMADLTDYERVKNMTEEEIAENAKSDPDAPLMTEEDLKKFKPRRDRHDDHKN